MATAKTTSETKKKATTTKKATTKKKKVEPVVEETMIEEVVEEVVEEQPKRGRFMSKFKKTNDINLDPKRRVPVVSVVSFPVGYQCKLSPKFIKWSEHGDEHIMTIEEIQMMNSEFDRFLHEPLLVVDDEEFAEAYKLESLYETIMEIDDLEEFYNQRTPIIKEKINSLAEGARRNLFIRTITLVKQGKLNNLGVLTMLRNDFNLMIEI